MNSIAQQVYKRLRAAPESVAQEVLDFLGYLESRHQLLHRHKRALADFVGALKDSPSFRGDPVAIQRSMRDEWD